MILESTSCIVILNDALYRNSNRTFENIFQLDVIHTVKHAQVPQAHAQQDSIFAAQPKSNKISTLRLDQNKANSVYGKQGAAQSNSKFNTLRNAQYYQKGNNFKNINCRIVWGKKN